MIYLLEILLTSLFVFVLNMGTCSLNKPLDPFITNKIHFTYYATQLVFENFSQMRIE